MLPGDALELLGPPARFVSRGGEKLEGALAAFHLDVAGLRCCDVGASTGGFTDCLLQSGAAGVVAVDVGRAQMHERLAADPRVILYERTGRPRRRPGRNRGAVRPCNRRRVLHLPGCGHGLLGRAGGAGRSCGGFGQAPSSRWDDRRPAEAGASSATHSNGRSRWTGCWESAAAAGLAPQAAVPSALKGAQGNVEFLLALSERWCAV